MRGQLRLEFIRLVPAIVVFICLVTARIAAAAAPVFQGVISSPGLCSPRGTAPAPGGDLFVGSDCHAMHHMERFDTAGNLVGTWAFPANYFGPPNGVTVDGSGNVYVIDTDGNRVLKFTSSGALIAGWGGGSSPVDLALDGFGDVYIAELNGKRVRKTSSSGAQLGTFGGLGSTPGLFQGPIGIGLDASGRIYVADATRVRILRFLPNGTFDMEFAPPRPPTDVAVGPDGNVYVVSDDGHGAQPAYQYSPSGVLLNTFESPLGLELPYRIVIDVTGSIFITEQITNRITKFQIDLSTPAMPSTFGRVKAIYR